MTDIRRIAMADQPPRHVTRREYRGIPQSVPGVGAVAAPRRPEDIAAMVAFLFSDDGAYVNGQTILVDGGANLT